MAASSSFNTVSLPSTTILAVIVFLCSHSLSLAIPPPTVAPADDELLALQELRIALQDSSHGVFVSWSPPVPKCNFTGIGCSPGGAVTEIELSSRGLAGALPLRAICSLRSLQTLSLGFNSLSGRIDEGLNSCLRLQYLDLGNNRFTGSFPDISSLKDLRFLYLNTSGFSGAFPWKSLEASSKNLQELSVGDNPLDPSPFPADVTKLYQVNILYLANCSIQGRVPPEIGNLTELRHLELSYNYLRGRIPPEIARLTNLRLLELIANNFTGRLPTGFRNLTNLQFFDASQNYLEGDLSELRFLDNLVSLQLFENRFTGQVPEEFGNFRRLVNLSLYTNNLVGQLPQKLGSWAKFNFIDVTENFLTGPIPPDMCKQGTMTRLLMIQNTFTGEIPASYANCSSLIRFRVKNNSLSGAVPAGIWGLPDAEIIDLRENQLEGPMTADISRARSLALLFLANNRLSGEVPPEISHASSLVTIDLSSNRFSGEIPAKIGNLSSLRSLDLQNNEFSGPVPVSLGSCALIGRINIAQNSLSGRIPPSLGTLPTLNSLNLSGNRLSGEIPATLSSAGLSLLDLSNNSLSGPIPQSLTIEAYNGSFSGNAGLCSAAVTRFRRCAANRSVSKESRALIACLAVALAIMMGLIVVFARSRRYNEARQRRDRSLREDTWDLKPFQVLGFTEDQILDSIKPENLIGKGGSGEVYRVALTNNHYVAVKHIWNSEPGGSGKTRRSSSPMLNPTAGKAREFEAEVQTLSTIRHVNVVKLYCSITGEDSSLLVYEYLPHGSLWDQLHACREKVLLQWDVRYDIAVGAAKGLEYLHHGCERPIIHRDVKSSNILLDAFLQPKISDFGLAKISKKPHAPSMDSTSQSIAGTPGYLAPEYGYTRKVNEKSDVYSFGVVLMELVTGRRPIEPEFGESRSIVSWVYGRLRSRESVLGMVDPRISPEPAREEALRMLRVAILCTARLPAERPTMRAVVKMLEELDPCRAVSIVVAAGKDTVA